MGSQQQGQGRAWLVVSQGRALWGQWTQQLPLSRLAAVLGASWAWPCWRQWVGGAQERWGPVESRDKEWADRRAGRQFSSSPHPAEGKNPEAQLGTVDLSCPRPRVTPTSHCGRPPHQDALETPASVTTTSGWPAWMHPGQIGGDGGVTEEQGLCLGVGTETSQRLCLVGPVKKALSG